MVHPSPMCAGGSPHSAEMQRLAARLMDLGLIRHPRLAPLERWRLSATFALLAIACIRGAAQADLSL